jgi:DNA (cytosine-5)-methyltransferase 1
MANPFLIKTANGVSRNGEDSRAKSLDEPMPTVCGNRGDMALIEPHLLPQQSDGRLRPVSEPAPTVSTAGAIALVEPFLVSFYGTGQAHDIDSPTPTVTCKDRFGLVRPVVEIDGNRYLLDIRFRMLQPHELALAQGFPVGYQFSGTKTDQVKQIGNAVPRRLARAIVAAVLSQNSDVAALVDAEEAMNMERGTAMNELCSFCGRPATKYHIPLPIKDKVFPKVPICGEKCTGKKRK